MSDHSFAPPGAAPTAPSQQRDDAPAAGAHTDLNATQPLPHGAAVTSPAMPPQAPAPGSGSAPSNPFAPGADGVLYTAEPQHDGSGYEPPQPPVQAERPVGRVRKSTVALIMLAALVLGAGAGLGGAWFYDEYLEPTPSVQVAGGEPVDRPADSVAAVSAAVMPSVVSIEASQGAIGAATGSGFVIREDGYILTNNHVVEDASAITVVMSDGSEYPAELVGATGDYDLAVLQIDATGLTPMTFADSDEVVVGDETIAVGSPLGLQSTVTTGIVSAIHRPVTAGDSSGPAYIDAIQTDAAINPGNSGGPLLNANGEVIGVNSAIAALPGVSSSSTGSVGLGFAIPSNQAQRTAEQLIETGSATYPVIGVQLDSRYTGEGVLVLEGEQGVVAGGPAEAAGIEGGDVITAIDGRPITQADELVVQIRAQAVGDDITLTIERDGEEQDVVVTLDSSAEVDFETGTPQQDTQE
ncbi:S1C family serine protease [Demequina sp. NBRC 110056]|uniref:S1C family serine protease n=1 Tax=Demequina sp. NBRC 110056 TaxID=1570345 RepID=UPI001F2A09EB|nr:trypsin-like peptidase domain-containing protein [Demequina sp. NBRC 110056]